MCALVGHKFGDIRGNTCSTPVSGIWVWNLGLESGPWNLGLGPAASN